MMNLKKETALINYSHEESYLLEAYINDEDMEQYVDFSADKGKVKGYNQLVE